MRVRTVNKNGAAAAAATTTAALTYIHISPNVGMIVGDVSDGRSGNSRRRLVQCGVWIKDGSKQLIQSAFQNLRRRPVILNFEYLSERGSAGAAARERGSSGAGLTSKSRLHR